MSGAAPGGFGYDPIFLPYGSSRTTAEMDAAEKDAISHRGQAFRALAPVLAELLAGSADWELAADRAAEFVTALAGRSGRPRRAGGGTRTRTSVDTGT